MKNPTRLVIVKWGDAWAKTGYYHTNEYYGSMVMTDVGYVCEENDETIVLCRSMSETDQQRELSIIPWCNVISVEEVVFE